jgi:DNA-binding GntR family transcriptional regulator
LAYTVWDQVHRARMVSLRLRPKPWRSNEEHRAVLEAIRSGDWKAARDTHHRHRVRAGEVITEILERFRFPQL